MLQRMEIQVLFEDPDDLSTAIAALIEHDFTVEVLNEIDPYSRAIWITAWATTDLDMYQFSDWAEALVEPFRGHVEETGPFDPPEQDQLTSQHRLN